MCPESDYVYSTAQEDYSYSPFGIYCRLCWFVSPEGRRHQFLIRHKRSNCIGNGQHTRGIAGVDQRRLPSRPRFPIMFRVSFALSFHRRRIYRSQEQLLVNALIFDHHRIVAGSHGRLFRPDSIETCLCNRGRHSICPMSLFSYTNCPHPRC